MKKQNKSNKGKASKKFKKSENEWFDRWEFFVGDPLSALCMSWYHSMGYDDQEVYDELMLMAEVVKDRIDKKPKRKVTK